MTTQTHLELQQLPYGNEAELVTDIMAFPGKVLAGFRKLVAALDEAIDMRNRYVELDNLDDATLSRFGIKRETIPQVVAVEAGLLGLAEKTPVADNSNDSDVRPAA